MAKKYKKSMLKMTLGDPRHWIGWLLSAGSIFGVFYISWVQQSSLWLMFAILLGVLVTVDVIKHYLELQ